MSLTELAEGISFDPVRSAVVLRADASLYPLTAIYAASYVFLDRCYVLLEKPDADSVRVVLSPKSGPVDEPTLERWMGELSNELLSCAWRAKIAEESRATLEAITTRALAGARGAPSLDDLEKFDFSDAAFDDPLGIAMSWEEKQQQKKAAKDAEAKP